MGHIDSEEPTKKRGKYEDGQKRIFQGFRIGWILRNLREDPLDLLKDPVNPIPHYRIGAAGRIVRIKKSEFDQWMQKQMIRESSLVDGVLEDFFN